MISIQTAVPLFREYAFLDYKFPNPQYLGAKYIHRNWITNYIPHEVQTVLDAFGGSQSIAYTLKQLGKKTYTNDFLDFSNQIGLALVENKQEILTSQDVRILFSQNTDPDYYNLFQKLFANLFFVPQEAALIDAYRSNVDRLSNKYKRALALSIMNRSMTRKVTMGHFAHTQALVYAASETRIKRNRSLVRPLRKIFEELQLEYNAAVFDNQEENKSFNSDILDLLPRLNDIDLVYFDPPYCNSHADYQSFYHLLETFTEYWTDKKFVNGTNRYEPKRHSGFDKKSEIIKSFQTLFRQAQHIPYWILSYNDRSYPDIETIKNLITPYRRIQVIQKSYENGRGGKGSVAGSHEILLICKPK